MTGKTTITGNGHKPHIVLIVARGEAVRNFLYSETLATLNERAHVTLLSVIDDEPFVQRFRDSATIVPLPEYPERRLVTSFRFLTHEVHLRWLWTEAVKNTWALRDAHAVGLRAQAQRLAWKGITSLLARRRIVEALTEGERRLTWALRPNDDFVELWRTLKPDLVFNTSHIHGAAADFPVRTAERMGIPTAAFVFSWDNPTSRSWIFPRYDYFVVWNERMRQQLIEMYKTSPERILVTGTPQFDFHFRTQFVPTRAELAQRIGIDPSRPYVLYTTSIARHFPDEHKHVELVAQLLRESELRPKPQLVVRMYVKGTSAEMKALPARRLPDVHFAPMLWEERWQMPLYDDLRLYGGLLRHAQLGINVGSTVSLELLMHDKPVINIAFTPDGRIGPKYSRYLRYVRYEHYRPVIESGAVMLARSDADLGEMLVRGCAQPEEDRDARQRLIGQMFGPTLDGNSGVRVAESLLAIAERGR